MSTPRWAEGAEPRMPSSTPPSNPPIRWLLLAEGGANEGLQDNGCVEGKAFFRITKGAGNNSFQQDSQPCLWLRSTLPLREYFEGDGSLWADLWDHSTQALGNLVVSTPSSMSGWKKKGHSHFLTPPLGYQRPLDTLGIR